MPNYYFAEKKALLEQIDSFMKQILTSLIYTYEVHVYTI